MTDAHGERPCRMQRPQWRSASAFGQQRGWLMANGTMAAALLRRLGIIALAAHGCAERFPIIRVIDNMPLCPSSSIRSMGMMSSAERSVKPTMNMSIRDVYRDTICAGSPHFVAADVAPPDYCMHLPASKQLSNAYRRTEIHGFGEHGVVFDEHSAESVALARWTQIARQKSSFCARPAERNGACSPPDIVVAPSLSALCFQAAKRTILVVGLCHGTPFSRAYWDEVRARAFDGFRRPPVVVVHADWPMQMKCHSAILKALEDQPLAFASRVVFAGIGINLRSDWDLRSTVPFSPPGEHVQAKKPTTTVDGLMEGLAATLQPSCTLCFRPPRAQQAASTWPFAFARADPSHAHCSRCLNASLWLRAGWSTSPQRELSRRHTALASATGPSPRAALVRSGPLLVPIPYTVAIVAPVAWGTPSGPFAAPPRPIAVYLNADTAKGNRLGKLGHATSLRASLHASMAAAGAQCSGAECILCAAGHECSLLPGTWNMTVRSAFCAEPGGDTPTRSHIALALLSGCVPVIWDFDSQKYNGTTWWPWRRDPEAVGELTSDIAERLLLDYSQFAVVLDARQANESSSLGWVQWLAAETGGTWWRQLQHNGQRVARLFAYQEQPCKPPTADCDAFGRLFSIVRSLI